MAQGPSDTILVAIRITLRIRESKVSNPDPPDRRRFVLSEHIFLFKFYSQVRERRGLNKATAHRKLRPDSPCTRDSSSIGAAAVISDRTQLVYHATGVLVRSRRCSQAAAAASRRQTRTYGKI